MRIFSIQRFLILAVLTVVLVAWGVSALFNFSSSQEQVEELFDAELAQMSRIIQSVLLNHLRSSADPDKASLDYLDKVVFQESFGGKEFTEQGHKYEKKLAFQVWDEQGKLFFENQSVLPKDNTATTIGYADLQTDKLSWRTFTLKDESYGFSIRTAQREDVRTELTADIAMNTLLPNLVMLPLLVIVLIFVIRQGLSPLKHISQALKRRDFQNLGQIPEDRYPKELNYLVAELNSLFVRVSAAASRERRFTADAAHELRTPLTISKVHLQNTLQVTQEEEVKTFVRKALAGIERLIHMVQQLLLLSRLDAQQEQEISKPLVLNQLINELVDEMRMHVHDYSSAVVKGKLCEIKGDASLEWLAKEALMRVLLRNLLDNAFRYAYPNSSVEISFDETELSIKNQCDFLDEQSILLSKERFKRGNSSQQGSGLGLSICQQIAELHGWQLTIRNRLDGQRGVELQIKKTVHARPR